MFFNSHNKKTSSLPNIGVMTIIIRYFVTLELSERRREYLIQVNNLSTELLNFQSFNKNIREREILSICRFINYGILKRGSVIFFVNNIYYNSFYDVFSEIISKENCFKAFNIGSMKTSTFLLVFL